VLPPLSSKTKEAKVADLGNYDSVYRQSAQELVKPLAPIFILLDDGSYVSNGVMFRAREQDGLQHMYTSFHVVDGHKTFYRDAGSKYLPIKFTQIGEGDEAIAENVPIPGKAFCMDRVSVRPELLRLYTLDVNTHRQKTVACSGYWDHGEFRHTSDTFPGQCGSPYVENNIVRAIHNSTNFEANAGYSVCPSDFYENPRRLI
jgi:hypothetical protein